MLGKSVFIILIVLLSSFAVVRGEYVVLENNTVTTGIELPYLRAVHPSNNENVSAYKQFVTIDFHGNVSYVDFFLQGWAFSNVQFRCKLLDGSGNYLQTATNDINASYYSAQQGVVSFYFTPFHVHVGQSYGFEISVIAGSFQSPALNKYISFAYDADRPNDFSYYYNASAWSLKNGTDLWYRLNGYSYVYNSTFYDINVDTFVGQSNTYNFTRGGSPLYAGSYLSTSSWSVSGGVANYSAYAHHTDVTPINYTGIASMSESFYVRSTDILTLDADIMFNYNTFNYNSGVAPMIGFANASLVNPTDPYYATYPAMTHAFEYYLPYYYVALHKETDPRYCWGVNENPMSYGDYDANEWTPMGEATNLATANTYHHVKIILDFNSDFFKLYIDDIYVYSRPIDDDWAGGDMILVMGAIGSYPRAKISVNYYYDRLVYIKNVEFVISDTTANELDIIDLTDPTPEPSVESELTELPTVFLLFLIIGALMATILGLFAYFNQEDNRPVRLLFVVIALIFSVVVFLWLVVVLGV